MNEKTYQNITRPLRKMNNGVKLLNIVNNIATGIVYCTYPVFLLLLIYKRDIRFWKVLTIPAVSFVIVSLFRKHINLARPYEVLDIDPLIKKDTKGSSFPSRHVFSVFVIAMTLYYISMPVSIILMAIGVTVAVVRVLGGVHFPRDVIAGAAIGLVCAIVGWKLLSF